VNYPTGFICNPTMFVSDTQLSVNFSTFGAASGTFPVYVVDAAPGGTSAPFNFTITPPPDFSITSTGTATQTVNAGQTATFTNVISVSDLNGFSAQVNLICSLPVTAKATTCTVNPDVLTSGSATVTVTTTARGLMPPTPPIGRIHFRPQYVPLFLITLSLALLMLRFARSRHQRLVGALPLAILALFLILQAMGCGGGGYNPPPPPPPPTGTPSGTYTVTVTGTSGSTTHMTSLTLTVN